MIAFCTFLRSYWSCEYFYFVRERDFNRMVPVIGNNFSHLSFFFFFKNFHSCGNVGISWIFTNYLKSVAIGKILLLDDLRYRRYNLSDLKYLANQFRWSLDARKRETEMESLLIKVALWNSEQPASFVISRVGVRWNLKTKNTINLLEKSNLSDSRVSQVRKSSFSLYSLTLKANITRICSVNN